MDMIEISFILVVVLILGLLFNAVNNALKGSKPEIINSEHLIDAAPLISDLPKRHIKNSHWFVKTFLRPRRKVI